MSTKPFTMKSQAYLILISLTILTLNGSCSGTITGESSGQFEVNRNSETVEERNGIVTNRTTTKDKIDGAFEHEFRVRIENGDTIFESVKRNKALPKLAAKGDCSKSMSDDEFVMAKEKVLSEFMDTDKLLSAKVLINQRCMSSNQVRDMLSIFSLDKYKLDFAKFAYGHTRDRMNYYRVNDAFSFSSTKIQLENFINSL